MTAWQPTWRTRVEDYEATLTADALPRLGDFD